MHFRLLHFFPRWNVTMHVSLFLAAENWQSELVWESSGKLSSTESFCTCRSVPSTWLLHSHFSRRQILFVSQFLLKLLAPNDLTSINWLDLLMSAKNRGVNHFQHTRFFIFRKDFCLLTGIDRYFLGVVYSLAKNIPAKILQIFDFIWIVWSSEKPAVYVWFFPLNIKAS